MQMQSRAAVFSRPGQPLALRSFPRPKLRSGEVLARVSCCTICGSDLHTIRGDRDAGGEMILGHEMVGYVEELSNEGCFDASGNPLSIGDRISWSVAASCGHCFYCKKGISQKCVSLFKYGHEPVDGAHPLSGGLAELCHLWAGTAIIKLPDSLTDVVACPGQLCCGHGCRRRPNGRWRTGERCCGHGCWHAGIVHVGDGSATKARSRSW